MTIEFVSYKGAWPCLCMGTLTLKINGAKKTFGLLHCDYQKFWFSGGAIAMVDDYADFEVIKGDWEIKKRLLPKELQPYADEISKIFNENVPHGCCGGCI